MVVLTVSQTLTTPLWGFPVAAVAAPPLLLLPLTGFRMVAFGLLLATVAIWPEGFFGVTFDGTAAAATAAFDEGRGLP